MELHYDITKQDFIDFNLNYYNNNAIVQRSIRTMRIATAAIVILGGSALMYWLHTLTPVSIAVYMRHKMIKNIEKILKNAKNKQLCGPKTLTLRESEFELSGENEDTVYQYSAVQRTATDDKHYYIFVDEFSAVIVPFSAFENDAQKQEFYNKITANIADEALKC